MLECVCACRDWAEHQMCGGNGGEPDHPAPSTVQCKRRKQVPKISFMMIFFYLRATQIVFFPHNSVNSTNDTESDSLGFWFGSPCPGLHCQSKFFFVISNLNLTIRSVCPCVRPDSQSYSHQSRSKDVETTAPSVWFKHKVYKFALESQTPEIRSEQWDLNRSAKMQTESCFKPHTDGICSDLLHVIGFQQDVHVNQVWAESHITVHVTFTSI